MGEPEKFFTVGMSDGRWRQFSSWFGPRGQDAPTRPSDAILVAAMMDGLPLIAGVCIYPTDGPYAVVERVATNPAVSKRLRYEAVLFGAHKLREYAAMRNKIMLCFPTENGVASILARAAFDFPKARLMRYRP